ncbi:MAG: NAD(P)-dependent dehydrogenase, short-chain alcohol dehydrogenase family [Chloroflexi bacterium]|nr:MAG: NAD(P)-dependent dehydrogenase, short-chain alcohol dehydrogenase family [Chloroflexota bacterium]
MGNRLEGRVAAVTGAGRGIGREHALSLAAEGAKVVVNDLGGGPGGQIDDASGSPADEVVAAIKEAGGEAVANYASVVTMEGGESIIQSALDTFGRMDILVNNAGILRDRMIYNMSEAEWDIVIAVHLKGHFTTLKPAAALFRQQRSGRIVNTSSESALGNMGQGNYAAAKEGIVGLTRVAARDLGRYGVTVNAIRPRAGTRLTLDPELLRQIERKRSSEGGGDAQKAAEAAGDPSFVMQEDAFGPENVAPFVTWLCTDEAANVNGRTFLVGGGEITLYTEPVPEGSVFSSGAKWSVDEVSEAARRTFLGKIKNVAPAKD